MENNPVESWSRYAQTGNHQHTETFPAMQSQTLNNSNAQGLAQGLSLVRRAMGSHLHIPAGFTEPTHVRAQEPVTALNLRLSDTIPFPSSKQARSLDLPSTSLKAGALRSIETAVTAHSRVAQAGARIIPVADAPVSVPEGEAGWYLSPTCFDVIEAAPFVTVSAEGSAPIVPLPLSMAKIRLADAASHAVSFKITRRDQKDRTDEELDFIITHALTLGLARACDSALLTAIVDRSPTPFSLAQAASRGVRFGELRAICGALGNGGKVDDAGTLRVNGIPAELSDVIETSVVGVFARSALAVDDEIRVVLKRVSILGDMEVTVFFTAEPLLPTSDFWIGGQ